MHKRLLSILVLSLLVASTLIGCAPSTLTILSISEGNVSVMKADTDSWMEAQVGMSLKVGDSIRTGDDSSAEITFFDGSTIELQAGTEIEINSLDVSAGTGATTITVEQVIGTTISRVTKILDPASRYEVGTPTGTVAVRGSIMQVYVIEDGTTWATNLEGDIAAIAQGVELRVPEGRRCVISPGQPPELVIFTDPNLEAVIREAVDKPTGNIYSSDLEGLASLDASQRNITDLTGLEYCTKLIDIELTGNQISDIMPLANHINLTDLQLPDNQISDISPLDKLTNLSTLDLPSNQISDISALANLTNLTSLYLHDNQVGDISPLDNLINLTDLQLHENQISDISPLDNLTNLAILTLCRNQISDISALANLTNLTGLYLHDNQVGDISPLDNLTELTWLTLWNNHVSDVLTIANLTNLAGLELGENQISDISPLVENEGLSEGDYVDLRWNPLTEDSVNLYVPQLEELGVKFNPYFPLSDTEPCLLDTSWVKNPGTGNYYALTAPMSWMAAEACAQALGGHLATLNNWEEESWIKDVFGRDEQFWIGFYVFGREFHEDNFIWSSGDPVTYTNWAAGEPNGHRGWEDVAVMNYDYDTDYWNDVNRDAQLIRGVVEVREKPS
jgi:Leucine-rich repeat (LRR) protein